MMVEPNSMLWEADHLIDYGLPDIWKRTFISENALVIAPWHAAANRLRELARGAGRHGSCGRGISEVQRDLLADPENALRVKDLLSDVGSLRAMLRDRQAAKAQQMQDEGLTLTSGPYGAIDGLSPGIIDHLAADYQLWLESVAIVDDSYLKDLAAGGGLIFEGSQGVLLDECYGFHPYTTWSTTTSENALTLLDEIGYTDGITKLGVIRAYMTRHGNGPFVTEDASLAGSIPEAHNRRHPWSGEFRYGHLDLVAHAYAVQANGGVDQVAVTCLDRLDEWRVCTAYAVSEIPDATEYFEVEGGIADAIKVDSQRDLEQQAGLTKQLFSCNPIYRQGGKEFLLENVEGALGAPVSILSYGATAQDKVHCP
jgi:adenylosuccinate synthase